MTDESSDLAPLSYEVSEEDHARIKAELAPGERVLWASRGQSRGLPFRGPYLVWGIVGIILFVGGITAIERRFPIYEALVILSLIIGLLLLVGVSIGYIGETVRLLTLHRKLYILTDRRALIWKPAFPPRAMKLTAVHRGDFRSADRLLLPNGTEDLQLGYEVKFEGISNGAAVDRLAREVLSIDKSTLRGLVEWMQYYLESVEGE